MQPVPLYEERSMQDGLNRERRPGIMNFRHARESSKVLAVTASSKSRPPGTHDSEGSR